MPHQLAQQAVGEIVEIAHPLAQIGIGHVQHARAHVALHLLHRRLRGQAVADRFLEPAHPASVVGEHAVGFKDCAVLALEGDIAARQHVVDREPQRAKRRFQPPRFLVAVLVEKVGDDDAGLMEHDVPQADSFVEGETREAGRPAKVKLDSGTGEPCQIAGGDHLSDHHGGGFEGFQLVVAIVPLGAVLHD